MDGDSIPVALPLDRAADDACDVTALYRQLRKPLLRYLVCLGLSADEAQDVVQDTFLTLHRHVTAERAQENLRGWVFRVAHNRARNRQANYARRFAAPLDDEAESIADGATPERAMLEKERLRQVDNAMAALPNLERECLLLRAAGLLYREIGEALQIPTSTVADTIDRAVRKLAEKCHV